MNLNELIDLASQGPPEFHIFQEVAASMGISVPAVMDQFSLRVAKRYMAGSYSYEVGDVAMNNLVAAAHTGPGHETPAFAWRVFLAFDAGEYVLPDAPAAEQGEAKTRELLVSLVNEKGV